MPASGYENPTAGRHMSLFERLCFWLVTIVVLPVTLAYFGLSEKLATAMGTGLIFGMMADFSATADWKRASKRDLLSWNTWQRPPGSAAAKPHQNIRGRLRTPAQRRWFVLGVFGIAVVVSSYVAFEMEDRNYGFIEGLVDHTYMMTGYKIATLLGLVAAIVGFGFAFWYGETIGRLVKWINTGQ